MKNNKSDLMSPFKRRTLKKTEMLKASKFPPLKCMKNKRATS